MPGKAGLVGLSLWIVSPIGDILDRSLGEVGIPVGFRYLGGNTWSIPCGSCLG